jgi:hypothetical protein
MTENLSGSDTGSGGADLVFLPQGSKHEQAPRL